MDRAAIFHAPLESPIGRLWVALSPRGLVSLTRGEDPDPDATGRVLDPDAVAPALAEHTKQPLEKVMIDTNRDFFMSPEAAKDYGIIDYVYTATGDSLIARAHDLGLSGGEGGGVPNPATEEEASKLDEKSDGDKKGKS